MFAIFGVGAQEMIILIVLGFVLIGLPLIMAVVAINFVWQKRMWSTGSGTRFNARVQVR
jgi:hypothetical protein